MEIIYEDNHLIGVHKPAGILTHSDKTGDQCITEEIKLYIKKRYDKPGAVFLNPVHRLDRPVSGLLLLARTSKATSRMTIAFKQKQTHKSYIAVSSKKPKNSHGTLQDYLLKNSKTNNTKIVNDDSNGGKLAILDYDLIGTINGDYVFRITPRTGRSHQIRVQLSNLGCPIIGDVKYGSKIKTDGRSILLHSFGLEFLHPVKKEQLELKCYPPKNEFWSPYLPLIKSVL